MQKSQVRFQQEFLKKTLARITGGIVAEILRGVKARMTGIPGDT